MTNFRTDFVANCRYICFTTTSSEDVDSCEVPVVSCISGVCGVGTRDPAFTDQTGFTKECDDGNLLSGDGCSNGCSIECGWECQGGALDSQDDCSPTACGDSKVLPTNLSLQGKNAFKHCAEILSEYLESMLTVKKCLVDFTRIGPEHVCDCLLLSC